MAKYYNEAKAEQRRKMEAQQEWAKLTRRCSVCHKLKKAPEMIRDASRTDGIGYRCKACDNKVRLERYYKANPR